MQKKNKNIEEVKTENIKDKPKKHSDKAVISKSELIKSVLKKASGYTATEYSDEYSYVDGELTLTKRKVSTKEVPPDTAAIKLLLESAAEKTEVTLLELEHERSELMEKWKKAKTRDSET